MRLQAGPFYRWALCLFATADIATVLLVSVHGETGGLSAASRYATHPTSSFNRRAVRVH